MLDELAIYNLSVKYPNTIDLVREVERISRAEAFDECIKFIKDHSSRAFIDSDGWGCTDNDREDIFKLFWLDDLEKLKEQNNEILP